MKNLLKIRIFLWSVLLCVIIWLIFKAVVPSGQIIYSTDFTKSDRFLGNLTPFERVSFNEKQKATVIGDPIYFSLRTPRTFDRADLEIRYKNLNPQKTPVVEAGLLVDKVIWRYELKPVENYLIDYLAEKWNLLNEDNLILLQKEKKYSTISEFKKNPPAPDRLAVYNYNFDYEYIMKDYESKTKEQSIEQELRGAYEFYVYIKDEDLKIDFEFGDLNRNRDSDPIDLYLYYQNQRIETWHLPDDGIITDSGERSETRQLSISVAMLPEGVYKLELRCNDDIITEKIKSQLSKFCFNNKIWLHNAGFENIDIYSSANSFRLQTTYPDSLQSVLINNEKIEIKETYKQISHQGDIATSTHLRLEKDGLILAGNGCFAFTEDSLFNPHFKKIGSGDDFKNPDFDFLLADYTQPLSNGEWREAEVSFDLRQAYRENQKYGFLLSVKGLDMTENNGFVIDRIKIKLSGSDWRSKLRNFLN